MISREAKVSIAPRYEHRKEETVSLRGESSGAMSGGEVK